MPLNPSYRGYVYLIGSRRFGWYKIGKANSPKLRVSAIGVLLPFKIELIYLWGTARPRSLESHLHKEFNGYRINGEWFSFRMKDVEAIGKIDLPYFSERVPHGAIEFSSLKADIIDESYVAARKRMISQEHRRRFLLALAENGLSLKDRLAVKELHKGIGAAMKAEGLTGVV